LASFSVTQWALWGTSIAVATVSVVLVMRDRGQRSHIRLWLGAFTWVCAAVLLLEPARSGIDYGQIEFVLMFIVVADVTVVPGPYRGLLIGIAAAIKLTPLIFIAVLLVERDWKSTARALASFVFCTLLAWALWPGLSSAFWDHDVVRPSRVGPVGFASNQSWYAILHRAPFPAGGSAGLWFLVSILTVGLAVFVAWRCAVAGRQSLGLLSIALAGLLVSPISWTHHWVWVLLIPPIIIGHGAATIPSAIRTMLWALVAITIVSPYWWFASGAQADALEALLPLWTFALLAVWSSIELVSWRGGRPLTTSPVEVVA
jgi:alpha-1,2-mannosyltransferase